jgi:iron complex transport system substrate-binding protein
LISIGVAFAPRFAQGAAPRRVISLSPNLTESVYAVGAGGLLVGISDFCQYPPEVKNLKRCGSWSYPNLEVVSALKPDLILVLGKSQKIRNFAQARGIAVEGFNMDNLQTIKRELLRLGRLLGHEAEATSLTRAMDADLGTLKTELDRIPASDRPTVLLSLGRQPGTLANILTPNGGSFLDEAMTLAGGRNVFGDLKTFYPQVSKESLLVRRPEVIIELTGGIELTPVQRRQLIGDWQALPSIPAVQHGRIYVLTQDYLMMPGPRQPKIVRTLRDVLFPKK